MNESEYRPPIEEIEQSNETLDYETEYKKLREQYFSPEDLTEEELERFLTHGELRNKKPIEELVQPVSGHADTVLTAELSVPEHKDMVLEAELVLPDMDKPLLVVCKPEDGKEKGTGNFNELKLPAESSPYYKKEVATWILAKSIGLGHLFVPCVAREMEEGPASVRPYLWGEPLELVSEDIQDLIFENESLLQEIALIDYLLQTLDRRESNLLWMHGDVKEDGQLKLIDNSLTFIDESFANAYTIKGPRLVVAYDADQRLKRVPLTEPIIEKVQTLLSIEESLRESLAELLTEQEISGIFKRAHKLLERGIFL